MPEITLINGDCLIEMKALADESIDLVLTDPPYLKDTVYIYKELAREAKRFLKEGSYLFAYCGTPYLPRILGDMGQYLDWFWLFEIKHNGGNPRYWDRKIMVGKKPVVVYTNGVPNRKEWLCDLHTSEKASKHFHKWGQSGSFSTKIIEVLTNKGDTIIDPFLGGGTTGVAAKELGRSFIGIEISKPYFEIAQRRINQAVTNLL